jgi:hypothetical protein
MGIPLSIMWYEWLGQNRTPGSGFGMVGGTAARSHVFASKGAFSAFVYIQGSTPGY